MDFNEIKEYAKEFNIPIIQDQGLEFLLKVIDEFKPKLILEIGSAIGYSSINMALNSDCFIDTIELNKKSYQKCLYFVDKFNLNSRINVINADCTTIDVSELGVYDLIFIDGPKAQYRLCFKKFSPLLKKGGVIISDNLDFHGLVDKYNNNIEIKSKNLKALARKIALYIDLIKNDQQFETTFYSVGDGMAVSRKK